MLVSDVFLRHRKAMFKKMDNNSLIVAFSRRPGEMTVEDKYEVNRNYYYLSGVMEYDNIVVLSKINGVERETIYIKPYDEFRAKWFGAAKSKETVKEESGIEDVRYLEGFEKDLGYLLDNVEIVYVDMDRLPLSSVNNESVTFTKNIQDKYPWINIKNGKKLFAQCRMIKEPEEIEEMEKAIEITNKGIQNILANIGEMYEYQLESFFDQTIKFNGATGKAFTTIAASGKNGTCLHYSDNNSLAKNGDLVLFDLGASLNMYCADISRTFPINGKFTDRQKQLYNIVLQAQQKVFETAKPGLTVRDLNKVVIDFYAAELKKIGLIKEDSEVSKYYYHGISHHIGLEVHDLSEFTPLEEGSVISNEPGLYIAEEGIGIRIEDDVLITKDGARWMSSQIIKTPEEIEEFIAKNRK